MKLKLDLEEILAKIKSREAFEADLTDGSVTIKIEKYQPYLCFAIHNGSNLRKDLKQNCLLSDQERWYEEDPHTGDFISSMPIVIRGNDSRYEYDLNREPKDAVYKEVWGKKVWKNDLTESQIQESVNKHKNFYKIVDALILSINRKFGVSVIFDIHSYNYKRWEKDTPVFNIGTEKINYKFQKDIKFWINELDKIKLPNIQNRVAENEVFFGKGYLLTHISRKFKNSLVLATEIKKVYCDELTGETYPVIIDEIQKQLKPAIVNTVNNFIKNHSKVNHIKKSRLLSSELNDDIIKIDKKLYSLAKNFEILSYINPVNIEQAKKEFFKSKYRKNPEFVYKQLVIDAFDFKRKLYSLPIENISDISLKYLYHDVIDSYADKIDIISSIGTNRFLYNSLRYFGEPKPSDIQNAEYLLHFTPIHEDDNDEIYSYQDVYDYFKQIAKEYSFDCKIIISKKIISKVQVINSKRTVIIRKDSKFSEKALKALASHELGLHMLTTINATQQALNVFRIGTPKNTHTQEGLAILIEYLSGNLTINRLHFLALRVIVIANMLKGYDFKRNFIYLIENENLKPEQAFYLTARVYRGGGFTKDYLYLQGFKDIYNLYEKKTDLTNLLIGKTSIKYLPLLNELTERKILTKPAQITKELVSPATNEPIIDYVLKGFK